MPLHTDLIRPGRWPKLITGKTTEAMPVVSISINYVSATHLAVKKEFDLNAGVSENGRDKIFDVFEIRFSGIFNRRTSK